MDGVSPFKNLILVESKFNRVAKIDFENVATAENKIDVGVSKLVEGNKSIIQIDFDFSRTQVTTKAVEVSILVKMVGIFEDVKGSDFDVTSNHFVDSVGPSLIYPFIRVHVQNLAALGGLGLLMVPPLTFGSINQKDPQG